MEECKMNINRLKPYTTEDLNRLKSAMKRIIENSEYGMMWHERNSSMKRTYNSAYCDLAEYAKRNKNKDRYSIECDIAGMVFSEWLNERRKPKIEMPQKTLSVYSVEHGINVYWTYKPTAVCYTLDYDVVNLFYPSLKQLISGKIHLMTASTIYPRNMNALTMYFRKMNALMK